MPPGWMGKSLLSLSHCSPPSPSISPFCGQRGAGSTFEDSYGRSSILGSLGNRALGFHNPRRNFLRKSFCFPDKVYLGEAKLVESY